MDADTDHYSWEEIYHLFGVITRTHVAQPSHGELGSRPTPLTDLSPINVWF
jgi:hypothetical protein